jgi:hypothetical protein
MTNEERDKLKAIVGPVMKYLKENHHPHKTIIIDSEHSVLVAGECAIQMEEFDD